MAHLFQLSDLHLAPGSRGQAAVLDRLVASLARERERAREGFAPTVVITGDVFDSGTDPPDASVAMFLELHRRIVDALGGRAPTVVLPGNHDRRRFGIIGRRRDILFDTLKKAADPAKIFVAGCRSPLLAEIVPAAWHGLPMHVVTYDSTYLPGGLIGAGGTIRIEDLLMVNQALPQDGEPLLVLTHHHLVPTPLTDVNDIDFAAAPGLLRWALRRLLPAVFSYGDREELTMTALGAGTALSTLHTFGRAVVLLHGHKHMPTGRLIVGLTKTCGDVLVASAGSSGTRERVNTTRHPDAARLWPSFNRIVVSPEEIKIDSLSFPPKSTTKPLVRRSLLRAKRAGRKWTPVPVVQTPVDATMRVAVDEARFELTPSVLTHERWDFSCARRVTLREGARLKRYADFVHALPPFGAKKPPRALGRRIELVVGDVTRYEMAAGLVRTMAEAARVHGPGTAFEWVGLLCRYGADSASLELARLPGIKPFASCTDLTTGLERPIDVEAIGGAWVARVGGCPPRSLLRMYWSLAETAQMHEPAIRSVESGWISRGPSASQPS